MSNSETVSFPKNRRNRGQRLFRDGLGLVRLFVRMVKDPTYRFPLRLKLLTVFALLYLVSPVDLIPDFIPLLGFADDVSLWIALLAMVRSEIKGYSERLSGRETNSDDS